MMFANTMYLRPGNLWKEFRRMKNQSANIGFMGSEPAFLNTYACNIRRLQGEKNGSACV